jgi:hypothetical protein
LRRLRRFAARNEFQQVGNLLRAERSLKAIWHERLSGTAQLYNVIAGNTLFDSFGAA